MVNILIGAVSGLVSGMGMGGRYDSYTLFVLIYGSRPACCTRCKPSIFYTYFNSCNNY